MKLWTLRQAQEDFRRGLLLNVRLIKDDGWMIEITSSLKADGIGYLGYTRHGQVDFVKVFKKIGAAIDSVEEIGFDIKKLTVN